MITVVLAEDNYLVHEGTRRLLVEAGEVDVVDAVWRRRHAAAAWVDTHVPDVVVTDIRMPTGTTTKAPHRGALTSARKFPTSGSPYCRSTSRPATSWTCSPRAPAAAATY